LKAGDAVIIQAGKKAIARVKVLAWFIIKLLKSGLMIAAF
jgi:hypothetical protein